MTFSNDRYVRSHGANPRGRGSWGFQYTPAGQTEERTVFAPGSMTLTEAKAFIRPLLQDPRVVYVAP
jgi:hypothetical protein